MDLIYEMLRQLAATMSLGTFLLVLAIIAISSIVIANFFIGRKASGFLSILTKEPKEPRDSKESKQIAELVTLITRMLEQHSDDMEQLQNAVREFREDGKETGEAVKAQNADVAELKRSIDVAKSDLMKDIEELKTWFKVHDLQDQQAASMLKDLMQRVLEILSKTATQLTAIEEFVRTVGPERRIDHKELVKGITDLSRDIALIERTIQTQVNSSNNIKLR